MACSSYSSSISRVSHSWRRKHEPRCIKTEWEENDIVIRFNCCDYPVLIGTRTEEDVRRGYSTFSCLPFACPCECYLLGRNRYGSLTTVESLSRLPKRLISPSVKNKFGMSYTIKDDHLLNVFIFYDNYFVEFNEEPIIEDVLHSLLSSEEEEEEEEKEEKEKETVPFFQEPIAIDTQPYIPQFESLPPSYYNYQSFF